MNYKRNYAIYYWKRYELENYFVTPKALMAFAEKEFEFRLGQLFIPLKEIKLTKFKEIVDAKLVLPVLGNDTEAFREYKELAENMQNIQFQSLASSHKLSAMLEDVFQEFAESEKEPLLLTKGNFYRLIDYLDNVPKEIIEKLEKVCEQLADEKGK